MTSVGGSWCWWHLVLLCNVILSSSLPDIATWDNHPSSVNNWTSDIISAQNIEHLKALNSLFKVPLFLLTKPSFKIQPNRSYQSGLAPPEYVDQIFWLCKYWLGFKLHGNGRIRLKRWWATFLSIFIFLDMKYFQILTHTIWTDLIPTQSNHF